MSNKKGKLVILSAPSGAGWLRADPAHGDD